MKHDGGKKERGQRRAFKKIFKKKEVFVKRLYHHEYAKEQPRVDVHHVKYDKEQIGLLLALTEFKDELPQEAHAYVFSSKQEIPVHVHKEYLLYNENGMMHGKMRCFKVNIDHESLEEHKKTFTAPIKLRIEGVGKYFKEQFQVDFGKDILGIS